MATCCARFLGALFPIGRLKKVLGAWKEKRDPFYVFEARLKESRAFAPHKEICVLRTVYNEASALGKIGHEGTAFCQSAQQIQQKAGAQFFDDVLTRVGEGLLGCSVNKVVSPSAVEFAETLGLLLDGFVFADELSNYPEWKTQVGAYFDMITRASIEAKMADTKTEKYGLRVDSLWTALKESVDSIASQRALGPLAQQVVGDYSEWMTDKMHPRFQNGNLYF